MPRILAFSKAPPAHLPEDVKWEMAREVRRRYAITPEWRLARMSVVLPITAFAFAACRAHASHRFTGIDHLVFWAILLAPWPIRLFSAWLAVPRVTGEVWWDHLICPRCGYDLRATPERCPECGATAPSTTCQAGV